MNSLLRYLYTKKEKLLPGFELKRIPPFGWLRSAIRNRMRRESVNIDGHTLFLDRNDALDLSIEPNYEPELTNLIRRKARPGGVFLDIGANIGYYTLLLARCAGPAGRVFAFEPDPENFSVLRKNIEANGYRNVVAQNKALSDKTTAAKLFLAEDNLGDHRIYDSGDGRRSIPIEMVNLDELFLECPASLDLVKMDIQGAECQALRGMRGVLTRSKNVTLFTEFWPYGLRRAGDDPEAYIHLLRELGFALYDVCFPEKEISDHRLASLIRSSVKDNPRHLDLMCVRGQPQ